MSVDLPAPLSPTTPKTSPASNLRLTRSSAVTAPKCFEMPRASSDGASLAVAADACTGCASLGHASAACLAQHSQHFADSGKRTVAWFVVGPFVFESRKERA